MKLWGLSFDNFCSEAQIIRLNWFNEFCDKFRQIPLVSTACAVVSASSVSVYYYIIPTGACHQMYLSSLFAEYGSMPRSLHNEKPRQFPE